MRRLVIPERDGWKEEAEDVGFKFFEMYGQRYWNEGVAYAFTLDEIENQIEDPCTELHGMCLAAVEKIVQSDDLMTRLDIPKQYWGLVRDSWDKDRDHTLYGRFDLIYSGNGPAKMIEYNADTPTSLYESASYQWTWLEGAKEQGLIAQECDQFNGLHEALVTRFAELFPEGQDVHFTSVKDSEEDYATVEYMAWCANEADIVPHYTTLDNIGVDDDGNFADGDSLIMGDCFKLYPWEDMLRDDFAKYLPNSTCRFLEPVWKAVLSNKGLLPVLWDMYPNHPNLLESYFEDDQSAAAKKLRQGDYVVKPIFSREGASIDIYKGGVVKVQSELRDYDDNSKIIQAYEAHPIMDGMRPLIGAWIVGDTCVGIGMREDASDITQDLSLFTPHIIEN